VPRFPMVRVSIIENRQVEPVEALGVGRDVDRNDLPALTVKPPTENGSPSRFETAPAAPLMSAGCMTRPSCEKVSAQPVTASDPRTSTNLPTGTGPRSARSTTSLSSTVSSAPKSPSRAARKTSTTSRWRARSASGTAFSSRTRRRARLASCRVASGSGRRSRDLPERHGERVVQDERELLGRGERLQHREEREADRVGQQGLVLGVGPVFAVHDRLRHAHAPGLLAPGLARAQHVEANSRHDRGQPPS
jgi:hypothetical protein